MAMKKKILIIGNGAKEYALAKKLSEKHDIFVTPSSDTLKEFTTCLDIRENNITELLEFNNYKLFKEPGADDIKLKLLPLPGVQCHLFKLFKP